ncbi:unnamed protein product [Strongylus vulgaris]|uniref:Uncharacterized protein n=1 Tax=Strongylus vulgaris TaxID=40348 RepID=A0A3P7J7A5_STRVU|nr:unnamed protein product [Strongylus vulgaris]
MFTKGEIASLIIGVVCLIASIVMFFTFPIIYPQMVVKNLQFIQNNDGSLGYSALKMANPPMRNIMKFYFFNITNPDEMVYEGAQPRLSETKAYAVM